jgi:sugar phosphate isomerase/epimerase
VESVGKCISPRKISEEQFRDNLEKFKKLQLPLYAVNIFMPGDLKLVGPAVNETEILSYAEEVFKRCNRAGVKRIIWGSGGARRVPDGFEKAKAKEQFISIASKVAVVAKKYEIDIALENLNHTETNFINTAEEALDVVKKVNRPNFRLCVDIYHMLKEGEPASVIEKTKGYLVYCEVAEKENRHHLA